MIMLKCTTVLLVLMVSEVTQLSGTPPFGSCPPGKEKCSECYLALKESLLSKDGNIQSLSFAFYPPREEPPEFVIVRYHFDNGSSQLWFWTDESSYLFFPLRTFQYLSLFFGKLEKQVTQSVNLTLDAECDGTKPEIMMLLTQRLKNFVQRKKYNPEIDENYFAKSEESTDDILTEPVAKYIIAFYAAGFGLTMLTTAVLIVTYLYTKRWDKKLKKLSNVTKTNKYSQSKIFGIAVTGSFINIYIFILDIFAELTLDDEDLIVAEKKLVSLPHIVLGIGCLAIIVCALCLVLSLCSSCSSFCQCFENMKDMEYFFLALSTLGPISNLVIHLPYITIAFLNDAYHASSVLITYTTIAFVLFGAVELTFGTCQGALIASKNGELKFDEMHVPNEITLILDQDRRATTRKLFVTNGNMRVSFLNVNQQQVKVKSAELHPTKRTFLEDLNNANNPTLTVQFGPRLENVVNDLICSIICTLKSSKDQEQSKVELGVPYRVELQVHRVVLDKNLIIFTNNSLLDIRRGTLLSQTLHRCPRCTKSKKGIIITFSFTILAFLILLFILIVMILSVLVVVPIDNAFSDAPNRLIGFYQSLLILGGAYLIYKKVFKKKPSIENIVRNREYYIPSETVKNDDTWQKLSKDERMNAFYSRIVDLIANYKQPQIERQRSFSFGGVHAV